MASVDILYIDITRRWSGVTPDSREAGKKKKHTNKQTNKKLTKKTTGRGQRVRYPWESEQITCPEIIACHSLSNSLWHCTLIIEMSSDHNVTARRRSDMKYSEIAPREECLRGGADGWRSHGPGCKGPYGGLWAECQMSSCAFREAEDGVCYFCLTDRRTGNRTCRKVSDTLAALLWLFRGKHGNTRPINAATSSNEIVISSVSRLRGEMSNS